MNEVNDAPNTLPLEPADLAAPGGEVVETDHFGQGGSYLIQDGVTVLIERTQE